jgi:hypothetical protein
VSINDKSLLDLLNSYLAIESLLNNRYISTDTKEKALRALHQLNEQFLSIINSKQEEPEKSGDKGVAA